MDHFRVAAGAVRAHLGFFFQHNDLAADQRQRAGHRQPHNACTGNDTVEIIHRA